MKPSIDTPRELGILPSSSRLIEGVRLALQRMNSEISDEQSKFELQSIDFILSELALREETAFFVEFQREAKALAAEGIGLLSARDAVVIVPPVNAADKLPDGVDTQLRFELIAVQINAAMRCLEHVIDGLRHDGTVQAAVMRSRIATIEHKLHEYRMKAPQAAPPTHGGAGRMRLKATQLAEYLNQRFPDAGGIKVGSFRQLVGGYQKTTILFETIDAAGNQQELVMRAEKSGERFLRYALADIIQEYKIVKWVYQAGIPAAEPLWIEADAAKIGEKFFVSRRVHGQNYGSAIAAETLTQPVARAFIATMAKLHTIPVTDEMRCLLTGNSAGYETLRANVLAYVDFWHRQPWMISAPPSPLTMRLATWLTDNVPNEDAIQCLVHCDFGPHNVLVYQDKVSAVLDWESTRIGDPSEDLICFLQSCRGQVSFDTAREWYQEATGQTISEYRLRYFDVFRYFIQMIAATSAACMYDAERQSGIEWCNFPLRWVTHSTAAIEEKIALAEQARK